MIHFKSQLEELQNEIKNLKKKVECLIDENHSLKNQIELLKNENELLKQENNSLKDKIGLNSKNSSIPSSKELYKIKKENKIPSKNKKGGQPGHQGSFRKKMLADTIIPVDFSPICECGGVIHLAKNPYVHQKVELPEIKPDVTEYHLNHGRCGHCGKRKTASLPPGVSSEVFGPRIQSIISSLTGFYKNSKREVVSILKDIFNLNLSVGSISHLENKVAIRCQSIYEKIEHQVAQDPLVHRDETSHFHQEKRGWCWLFSSKSLEQIKRCYYFSLMECVM